MATKLHPILIALLLLAFFPSCREEDDSKPINYAVQVLPDINSFVPTELLEAFGEGNLHYGDTPPFFGDYFPYDHAGTCFSCDSLHLSKFVHNTDIDPNSEFNMEDSTWVATPYYYMIQNQHRGIAEHYNYERVCRDEQLGPTHRYLSEYASEDDYIFIMGEGAYFTIYLKQQRKYQAINLNIPVKDLVVGEFMLISGKVTRSGVEDFHMATRIEDYSQSSPLIGSADGLPQVHDIFVYDAPDRTLTYNANYYREHSNEPSLEPSR